MDVMRKTGARVSLMLMATVAGMAIGGWMLGAIYDLTGSYRVAFLNGIAWNLLMAIAFWLLLGRLRSRAMPAWPSEDEAGDAHRSRLGRSSPQTAQCGKCEPGHYR
jgi:hypothetical protein